MTRSWSVPTLLLLLTSAAVAVSGCSSPQQRYKVLSFFFDGVPTPEERAAAKAAAEAKQAEREGRLPTGSTHKPVVERRCGVCHGVSEVDAEARAFSGIDMSNVESAWRACKTCHSNPDEVEPQSLVVRKDRWMHGPIALGECRSCHLGHRSDLPHLLREEQQESICRKCHVDVDERGGTMAALDCSVCHDPHFGSGPSGSLLRDGAGGNCAQCHALDLQRERTWLHGPVAAGTCVTCHDAHGGKGSINHVVRPLRPVCLSCHDATELSRDEHPEADTEECDTCHVPHAANNAEQHFLKKRIGDAPSVFVKPDTEGANAPIPED